MVWLTTKKDGTLLIGLHIQPKASRTKVVGIHDQRVKIAVASPPVDGKANKAVEKFLARLLGVPALDVTVVSGLQSRQKQVAVGGLDEKQMREQMEPLLKG